VTLSYNQVAARGLERIAALSDGVFAIAMTLIVFEIRVPDPGVVRTEQDLWAAMVALGPRLITYLLSFLTLGIFWTGQQTQSHYFARSDRHLAWLQLAFLAAVALMPFTTSLLAEFITLRPALIAYWANILLLGVLIYASWRYARHAGLVKPDAPVGLSAAITRRVVVAQALYGLGAAIGLISPAWGIAFIVIVQLNFAIAPRIGILARF